MFASSHSLVTVDPSAQKYLGLYPLPNGPVLGDTALFTFAGQQVISENFFTARVDHKFSSKDSLFGTYMYDDTPFSMPDSFNDLIQGHHTNRQVAVLEEDHIFTPSLFNSARVGFNRAGVADLVGQKAVNPLADDPTLGAVPGQNAAALAIGGLAPQFKGGLGSITHYVYYWNSFQGYDDAFLTRGTHSLKFGAAFERMQMNYTSFGTPGGAFNFGSLSDFLTNHPKRFNAGFPQNISPRGLRQSVLGLYVQDDWRWRPNLTFNLGLRYEIASVPTEVQNKLPTLINLTDATPHLGNPFFENPTLRNFEPRAGFAWDPFRDGKTSVRGGFGIFDVLPLPYEFYNLIGLAAPFYMQGTATHLPPGSFYAGAFQFLGSQNLGTSLVQHNPPRNYVMQWNFNLQRELAPDLTAMVGYVGSRGVHQPFRCDDMNIVMPTLTSAGYLWPSPVASGTLINPNLGQIKGLTYGGSSFFSALEVGVQKRMSHGVQLQGSFTWGKSIDTSSATLVGDAFANAISSPHWFDLRLSRGLSDFNIGRTLVLNGTWQVPQPKSLSGPAGWAVRGWQLGAIFKANDGVPFTATFGTDGDPLGLSSSDTWDFPDRLSGPGCAMPINPGNPNNYIKTQCFAIPSAPSLSYWTANCDPQPLGPGTTPVPFPQCFNLRGNSGRNVLIGPGLANLDFSTF